MASAEAAVDDDGLARDPGGFGGGEKEGGVCDIFRFAEAAERMSVREAGGAGGVGEKGSDEGSADEAGTDAVDANAVRGVVEGHVAGQGDQGAFSGGVSGAAADSGNTDDAAQVNDAAAAACAHAGDDVLRGEEGSADIDGEEAIPGRGVVLLDGLAKGDAGGVDQDVDGSVDGGESGGDLLFVRHVDALGEIQHVDAGAFGAEAAGDRGADAGSAAGDDGAQMIESHSNECNRYRVKRRER